MDYKQKIKEAGNNALVALEKFETIVEKIHIEFGSMTPPCIMKDKVYLTNCRIHNMLASVNKYKKKVSSN